MLEQAIRQKEKEVTEARREGIRLLEDYLRDSTRGNEQAEALYKLAELYWEESKAAYLDKMERYQAAVTACHENRSACPHVPRRPPTVDLARAQSVYDRLIKQYPRFRKIDTVIYLYAFSLRDQGKLGEAIKYFQIIIDRFPRSRFTADAWMAIAEYRFYEQQNYKSVARSLREGAEAPEVAALRPGAVQDRLVLLEAGTDRPRAPSGSRTSSISRRRRPARPRPSRSAPPSCRGRRSTTWSSSSPRTTRRPPPTRSSSWRRSAARNTRRRCCGRLADTVFDQTRYERAIEAYRLLIQLDPNDGEAPDYQKRIVESYQLLGDVKTAVVEMRKLADTYGGRSAWANANKDRPKTVQHARTMAEELIRNLAKSMHAEAQQNEKTSKVVDKERYARAAEAYQFYLANFADASDAVELRYLRADILNFKLQQLRRGRARVPGGRPRPRRSASTTRTRCCRR